MHAVRLWRVLSGPLLHELHPELAMISIMVQNLKKSVQTMERVTLGMTANLYGPYTAGQDSL
ncbi:MAG TPA: hypothetical protein DDW73_12380 [Rhizobium sp.]|nr:hypothetical protein [Rhizobium sp.]